MSTLFLFQVHCEGDSTPVPEVDMGYRSKLNRGQECGGLYWGPEQNYKFDFPFYQSLALGHSPCLTGFFSETDKITVSITWEESLEPSLTNCVCMLRHVWLSVTPWTVVQASWSTEFSRQGYWSRSPSHSLTQSEHSINVHFHYSCTNLLASGSWVSENEG